MDNGNNTSIERHWYFSLWEKTDPRTTGEREWWKEGGEQGGKTKLLKMFYRLISVVDY